MLLMLLIVMSSGFRKRKIKFERKIEGEITSKKDIKPQCSNNFRQEKRPPLPLKERDWGEGKRKEGEKA